MRAPTDFGGRFLLIYEQICVKMKHKSMISVGFAACGKERAEESE
jgi:hypothetical protein